jgi:hypothetical protein
MEIAHYKTWAAAQKALDSLGFLITREVRIWHRIRKDTTAYARLRERPDGTCSVIFTTVQTK